MALTKLKKQEVISEVEALLKTSKMTIITKYQGTTVKALQTLRREARQNGTQVKVIKNRLVIKALENDKRFSEIDRSALEGMLLYAFNADDEAAPAQCIAQFARKNPTIEFIGAITEDGTFMGADDVKALAALPSKDQLRAILAGMLAAPLSGFVSVVSGNLKGLLYVMNARANNI